MLSLFTQVQYGLTNPKSLAVAETTRRVLSVELSKYKDLEPIHRGGINVLDIDKSSQRYLISGGADGGLAIHDLRNLKGQPNYTCKVISKVKKNSKHAHNYSVETVQWYPHDTGLFVSSGMDCKLKVWDTVRLRPAETFSLYGRVYKHHMSNVATNHYLVATALSYPHVVLVDLRTGCCSHELRGHKGKVVSIQWSPSEQYLLASGGSDNRILLWDIRSSKGYLRALDQHNGEEISTSKQSADAAHDGIVNSLLFSPDGLYLVSYGTDSRLRLWDVASSQNTMVNYGKIENDCPKAVQIDMCYNSCPSVIFVPSFNNIFVLDMFSGERIGLLHGHFNSVNCCFFHPWYHELYSGGNDRNILLWTPDVDKENEYADYQRQDKNSTNLPSTSSYLPVKRNVTADNWSSDDD